MTLHRPLPLLILLIVLMSQSACSREPFNSPYVEQGVASWYGWDYGLRKTASGERYKPWTLTAAHKTLPFGTIVRVTRLDNGKSVDLRINDRGPFAKGRIIDVSKKGARELDLIDKGVAPCKLEVVKYPDPPASS